MLNLSRRRGESIVIIAGEHRIEITVTRITPTQVVLATDAPIEVSVNRREIQDEIDEGIER